MKLTSLLSSFLFISFLNASRLEDIQQIPKAELHLHLGGSYPLSYLKTIATPQEFIALQKGIDLFADGVDYKQCFFVFNFINKIINTNKRVEDGAYFLCKELQKDNVTYVEIRTGLKDLENGFEGYLNAVINGIKRAAQPNFEAKILLSLKRKSTPECAQKTVDLALKYRDKGVVGIDIGDSSVDGNIINILPILVSAKAKGIPFVVHMGESPQETDQMLLLQHLEPVRIGHGVYLSSKAVRWIKNHNIPLEVCLSSSVCARMVKQHALHPGLKFYSEGHPVAVCTDDPLIFKVNLSQEYDFFLNETEISFDQLKELIKCSYNYRIAK